MKLVVIGGSAAGMAAAAKAKRAGEAEVIVFERSKYVSYAPCGIPYYFEGLVKSIDSLVYYTADYFREKRGIDVRTERTVIEIDESHVVAIDKNGREEREEYDRLMLATGGKAFKPDIEGIDLNGIHTIRLLEDGEKLYKEAKKAEKIGIVGAGYIGIEMAEAFIKMGKKVSVFEMMPHVMPGMDEEMARIIENEMISKGVDLHLNEPVIAFQGKDRVEKIVTEKGEYNVDIALLSIGVKPNVDFAKKLGLKLGKTGAIKTNEYMESSRPGIYAAGDNVETKNIVTGKETYAPLAPAANKMGRVAGENAVAGNRKIFPGVVGTAITKFFDLHIGKTGLSLKEAGNEGVAADIEHGTRSHYYPGNKKINVRLVASKDSHRIIGGQIVGREGVVGRINTLAAIITAKMKAEELAMLDMAYAPPFAPVWDALIVAANVIQRKLK
ncbi:MAG: FAD-dependent oxidoreductase [Thermoplasmata archaeon]|nr:FAD-dependent oxidoreductase [Thermoplasmata archaeon]